MKLVVALCFIALATANQSDFFLGVLHGAQVTDMPHDATCQFKPSVGLAQFRISPVKIMEKLVADLLAYSGHCGYTDAA